MTEPAFTQEEWRELIEAVVSADATVRVTTDDKGRIQRVSMSTFPSIRAIAEALDALELTASYSAGSGWTYGRCGTCGGERLVPYGPPDETGAVERVDCPDCAIPEFALDLEELKALHFHYAKDGIPETQTAAVRLAAKLEREIRRRGGTAEA